jgi:hypothetical protein
MPMPMNIESSSRAVDTSADAKIEVTSEQLQLYSTAAKFGVEVVRGLLLINGGAIVTLLALSGNLASSNQKAAQHLLSLAPNQMLWFLCGLISAIAAAATGYLNGIKSAQHLSLKRQGRVGRSAILARYYRNAGVFFCWISTVSFGVGIWKITNVITDLVR